MKCVQTMIRSGFHVWITSDLSRPTNPTELPNELNPSKPLMSSKTYYWSAHFKLSKHNYEPHRMKNRLSILKYFYLCRIGNWIDLTWRAKAVGSLSHTTIELFPSRSSARRSACRCKSIRIKR